MSWIHAVVDVPADLHAVAGDFWGRALGWSAGDAWDGHPELRSFQPPSGTPYLHLQRIDGPPRVHIDVEAEEPDEWVTAAVELGAEPTTANGSWHTLLSPGGLPFCVLRAKEHTAPQPVTHPDGHRTRMVQVCIDSPRAEHEAEVAFWRAVLPGRWVPSEGPEFAGKWHDGSGSPIQLLFQELGDPDGPVRAHLDLGTDDLTLDVSRLIDLGATEVGAGRGWHVFIDPAGLPFCTTSNSPEQARRRDLG